LNGMTLIAFGGKTLKKAVIKIIIKNNTKNYKN